MKPAKAAPTEKDRRAWMRERRHLTGYLRALCGCVEQAVAALDKELRGPSTPERGKRIATIANALEFAKDSARHFGLGVPLPEKPEVPHG